MRVRPVVLPVFLLAAATIGSGAVPAVAAPIADASVTVASVPTAVSPVGGMVLYRVTVRNDGPALAPVTATDTTTGGSYVAGSSTLPSGCSAPADGTADPVISCNFGVQVAGWSSQISVAIRTPSVVSSVTNAATAEVPPSSLGVIDDNPSNDSASVVTPVTNDLAGSAALLRTGETMAFQAHRLTVRSAAKGVIASMKAVPAQGDACGTTLCDAGLHVGFDTDAEYQGQLGLWLDFGKGNPCRGLGAPSDCSALYMRKDGVVTRVPICATAPQASPCIEETSKDGPVIRWLVRLASQDPDFVPPLGKLGGSS